MTSRFMSEKTFAAMCVAACWMALAGCGDNGLSGNHNEGRPSGTGAGTILTWTTSVTPTSQTSGTTQELNNIAFGGNGNGLFVAVGAAGTILTSADAVNWTARLSTTTIDLFGVVYAAGQFIAVGGDDFAGAGVVLNGTPDGVTWTMDASFGGGPLTGVTFANNQFVAVGGNQVLSSPDGITWNGPGDATSGITSDTVDLYNTAFGNNMFVTVGTYNHSTSTQDIPYMGLIATSTDANTWSIIVPYQSNYLSGVTFGGGQFIAVGREGLILNSSDGTHWATQSAPQLAAKMTPYLISVTYAGGQYVATGNYVGVSPSTGFILTSPDATTWTVTPTGANVYGIAYGSVAGVGTYVAVGGE